MPYRRDLGAPSPGLYPPPLPFKLAAEVVAEADRAVELYNPAMTLADGDIVVVSHRAGEPSFRLFVDFGKGSVAVSLIPSEWAELRGAANRAAERILEGG